MKNRRGKFSRSLSIERLNERCLLTAFVVDGGEPGNGINETNFGSSPVGFFEVSNTLYFTANDGVHGNELWRVDPSGSLAMVEDTTPGAGLFQSDASPYISQMTNVNGVFYFRAPYLNYGERLWRIGEDGVARIVEGVEPASPIAGSGGVDVNPNFANVNGTLYFEGKMPGLGSELLRINELGNVEVVEDSLPGGGINPGAASSDPSFLLNVNGTLYFSAKDGTHVRELWRVNSQGLAEMVEDDVPGGGFVPDGSDVARLTEVNGTLYFVASSEAEGSELWRVNSAGTAEWIRRGSDQVGINSGPGSSSPRYLTNVDGILYFQANDGLNGAELWKVNSLGVAELVEDGHAGGGIGLGSLGSFPTNLTSVAGSLYFSANDGTNGRELWRVAESGIAEMVEDSISGGGIAADGLASNPVSLLANNGTVYFAANDGVNGTELWRIGEQGLAEMVGTATSIGILPGSRGSSPLQLTSVGAQLYFVANDGTNGFELWRIDSQGHAELVDDSIAGPGINPDAASADVLHLTNVNGTLYFRAKQIKNGEEPWRIQANGVAEMVGGSAGLGINSISRSADPFMLRVLNGSLYFGAYDGLSSAKLWRTTGSTAEFATFPPDAAGNVLPVNPSHNIVEVNGTIYVAARDPVNGLELRRINQNGDAELIEDSIPGGGIAPGLAGANPEELTNVNGVLYFRASDGVNGTEIWRIGANGLAEMVEDYVLGGGIDPGSSSSSPFALTNMNGTLYFRATQGNMSDQLWRINGEGKAEMVQDLLPGLGINSYGGSRVQGLTMVQGTIYFTAYRGYHGYDLFRIHNATGLAELVEDSIPEHGIHQGFSSVRPSYLTDIQGTLFFMADDGVHGSALWRVNGAGNAEMVVGNGAVESIYPGQPSESPIELTNVNGTLYFSARDNLHGWELWRFHNGQFELVNDTLPDPGLRSGTASSNPRRLQNIDGILYFTADDGVNGTELWRVPRSGIAELVEDSVPGGGIRPGPEGSAPGKLVNVNGTIFFPADDGSNGVELWQLNKKGEASMVEDTVAGGGLNEGNFSSSPTDLINYSGTLYFSADGGLGLGRELWGFVPNQSPTSLTLSNQWVAEGASAMSVIGDLVSNDPDPGETFTYHLIEGAGATDNGSFEIAGTSLRIHTVPDFESKSAYSIRVRTIDSHGNSLESSFTIQVANIAEASVTNRRVFYNRSSSSIFGDGTGNPESAIDPSKSALMPGELASFENYTNYIHGLNGLIVDMANLRHLPSPADFQFSTFDGRFPLTFLDVATTPTISLIQGGGLDGASRIKIEFPNDVIRNTWLRVRLIANDSTDLLQDDIFYFGNAVGDMNIGNTGGYVRTNASDTAAVRQNQSVAANSVGIIRIHDVNKDGRVNATDTSLVRQNQMPSGTLFYFSAPTNLPSNVYATDHPVDSVMKELAMMDGGWHDSFETSFGKRRSGWMAIRKESQYRTQ